MHGREFAKNPSSF
jgi:hypothetical protein